MLFLLQPGNPKGVKHEKEREWGRERFSEREKRESIQQFTMLSAYPVCVQPFDKTTIYLLALFHFLTCHVAKLTLTWYWHELTSTQRSAVDEKKNRNVILLFPLLYGSSILESLPKSGNIQISWIEDLLQDHLFKVDEHLVVKCV